MSDCGDDMCCADDGVCDASDAGGSDDWVDTDDISVGRNEVDEKTRLRQWIENNEKNKLRLEEEVEMLEQLRVAAKSSACVSTEKTKAARHAALNRIARYKEEIRVIVSINAKHHERIETIKRQNRMCDQICIGFVILCVLFILFADRRALLAIVEGKYNPGQVCNRE
jgi:hypothetical protein